MSELLLRRSFLVPSVLVAAISGAPNLRAQGHDAPPASIAERIESAEYAFSDSAPGVYSAPNRAQNLRATVDSRGLSLTPRTSGGAAWTFALRTSGFGRGGARHALATPTVRRRDARVELEHGVLVEWFANDARGVEQGWTIGSRPAGALDAELVVDVAIGGGWSARIAPDGESATLLDPAGRPELRYHGLGAWDAGGRALEARIASALGGLSIVVDDHDAAYPITIDPILGRWAWTYTSTQADARLGAAVASAGDVNGDGRDDVIVGTPDRDGSLENQGRASLFLGSTTGGLLDQPSWEVTGVQANGNFGASVAGAGDVDGDGFDDVVVGEPAYANGQPLEGRAYLYRGTATGLQATPAWTFEPNRVNAALGCSVASAGDVNGDGYDDVIVGALGDGLFSEGTARLFLGSATGLSLVAAWTSTSGQTASEFGCSVASAGDVNGDGFDDVIVGSRTFDAGQSDEGRAYLYLGSASGLGANPAWTGESDQAGARFGESVASARDVNGDGFDDLIVGAYAYDEPGIVNAGRAFAYLGSATGPSAVADWSVGGTQALAFFGIVVAGVGDVDGDGFADVAIAASYADVLARVDAGAVSVHFGTSTGIAVVANAVMTGELAQSRFGTSISAGGDVNADGLSDFVVGAPNHSVMRGRALTFLGRRDVLASTPSWTASSGQSSAGFGLSANGAGDVNGDGFDDVIVGAPDFDHGQNNEGRAYVYLGSASGLHPQAAWIVESDLATARFGVSVAAAGDVNGDGFDDVIVGAPDSNGDLPREGAAYVYLGSASGLATTPAWVREGDQTLAHFGWVVDGAGDVNGDGFDDVIVGAPNYDGPVTDAGRAFVFLGSAAGLDTNATWMASGDVFGASLGIAVNGIGDVDGDGFDDVAASASMAASSSGGRVSVYVGSASGPSLVASWSANGAANAAYGGTVDGAGDVDNDGYGDLIVGAHLHTAGQTNEGRAFLFRGSATGLEASPSWTAEGDQANARFGYVVRGAGDVDGDGYGDVVIGASHYSNGVVQEGRAFLYTGSAAGLSTSPAWSAESDQSSSYFGTSVAAAGDVDGDGFGDVIVGAPGVSVTTTGEGRVHLYRGGSAPVLVDCNGNSRADDGDILFGTSTDVDLNFVPDECEVVAPVPFCFGDGSSTACPCGNSGATGNGCATSFNPAGANVAATGTASVSGDSLVLHGGGMSQSVVTFTQGTQRAATLFGDGLRCVTGTVLRLGALFAPGGQADYPSGGSQPVSIRGQIPAAGGIRHYQVWFRNAAAFCTNSTFNLTNGVTVYWMP